MYASDYNSSWALIIGVDNYDHTSPLLFAQSDADAVRHLLVSRYAFPETQVTVLLDTDATRQGIHEAYLALSRDTVHPDDRIVVFFAGHGVTLQGRRGEVGFLVPVDGDPDDVATLVRWDEWTRNAELIRAKHVLFLMDACYGGLALQRATPPGSMRFVGDMLRRYSRQVLTAGKADEAVADGGGPRPNHSIFTGHLLDALEDHGATEVLTANQLMAQVYTRVARDPHSRQTPHYGFLEGDGDFVFNPEAVVLEDQDPAVEEDVLVQVPTQIESLDTSVDRVKRYLADSAARILLDDLVSGQVRNALARLTPESFPTDTRDNLAEVFSERLRTYEALVQPLQQSLTLIARWGEPYHRATLTQAFERIGDGAETEAGGLTIWLGLRWYPCLLLLYSVGVGAILADRYELLAGVFNVSTGSRRSGGPPKPLIASVVDGILEVDRANGFKQLPEHERHFVPRSEYLFKTVQPPLEDLLFLGLSYERLFDRFEVLAALTYLDLDESRSWAPIGRFGYKAARGYGQDPLTELVAEAERAGEDWTPLRAGMFHGSLERFRDLVQALSEQVARRQWF